MAPILGIWQSAIQASKAPLVADILVIAGGGSGGDSGGGGAGGLLAYTSQSLTVQNYTVTVGGGGAAAGNDAAGNLGNDSQFGSLTASKGGGRGRGYALTTTGNGGSGGGGSGNDVNSQAGGSATSGQGNNGGAGTATFLGGGGGGAGAVGGSGSGTSATGGNGSSTYSSWGLATGTGENVSGTYYFAGGGGGGGSQTAGTNITAGGLGGGGDGNATTASGAKNAMANTGGGGGGADGGGESSGAGGSGIVIVRYSSASQKALGGTIVSSGGYYYHTFTSSGVFYTGTTVPVSGYSLWLDASDASTFTYSSGTRVSQWNDKSANGYHFTQSNTTYQPDRVSSQNGLSAVKMKVTSQIYYMSNSSFNYASSAFTVLAVARYNLGNYSALLSRNSTSGLQIGAGSTPGGGGRYLAISRIGQATDDSSLSVAFNETAQVTYKSAGISSGSVTVQIYKNGTAASGTETLSSLGSGDQTNIGASTNGGGDNFGDDGFICEILVYPSQLSDTDRALVENYLRAKWGTA